VSQCKPIGLMLYCVLRSQRTEH